MNTLRPRQNGRHFPDGIFKWIFLNKNVWIWINISLKFFLGGPINNVPAFVQTMAWLHYLNQWWPGLVIHICTTRPHLVKKYCTILDLWWNSGFFNNHNPIYIQWISIWVLNPMISFLGVWSSTMSPVCALMVLMMTELMGTANAGSHNNKHQFYRIKTLYSNQKKLSNNFVTCCYVHICIYILESLTRWISNPNFRIYFVIVNWNHELVSIMIFLCRVSVHNCSL